MSDQRYAADITKGLVLSAGGTQRSFRWPDEIPGLGGRVLGAFTRCAFCPPRTHIAQAWTWVTYGGKPACEACAVREATARAAAA